MPNRPETPYTNRFEAVKAEKRELVELLDIIAHRFDIDLKKVVAEAETQAEWNAERAAAVSEEDPS